MSVVSSQRTGRQGFTATFRRASPVWESSTTWDDISSPTRWAQSRTAVLYLAAMERGEEDAIAQRMARSGMVVWANESGSGSQGWGWNEYRWNGWGCHPFEGSDVMRFGAGDPELAAFVDIAASARKFWEVVLRDAAIAALFRAGDPLAYVRLAAGSFGGGTVIPEADARSIYARLERYLNGDGAGSGAGGSSGARRRTSGGGKWIVAAAIAAFVLGRGSKRS